MDKHRLDKWLWAARFFKTRALAADEIAKGRVTVNEQVAKASRELREGDVVELRQAGLHRTLVVRGLSRLRGPATTAQALYEETEASVERRLKAAAERKLNPEPALASTRVARPSATGASSPTGTAGARRPIRSDTGRKNSLLK